MNRDERLDAILKLLSEDITSVAALTEELGASPATIRRDLNVLAQRNLIERTHGGARERSVAYDLPRRYRRAANAPALKAIAKKAVEKIPVNGVIGFSGGATTTAVARELSRRDDLIEGLTIVTNAVDIAVLLAVHPQLKVVVTGGVLNQDSYELIGAFADQVLQSLWLDVAFIGVSSFDSVSGGCTISEREAHINSIMAHRAEHAIVVADSSKYGRRAFATIGGIDTFPSIITDRGLPQDARDELASAGFQVEIADPSELEE